MELRSKSRKSNLSMGNDNCGCLFGWPKAKKSKKNEIQFTSNWSQLPSVILHELFKFLNHKERINASSACRNWRHVLYHPYFWKNCTFVIEADGYEKSKYFNRTISGLIKNAIIRFDSLTPRCMSEFIILLQNLTANPKVRSLILQPSHCRLVDPSEFSYNSLEDLSKLGEIVSSFCDNYLERFSIGCCEDLCQYVPQFLQRLIRNRPEKVTVLGLASLKDDPCNYVIYHIDPASFSAFRNLQIISVDYDYLSDDFLDGLKAVGNLKRLITHVHGILYGQRKTSDEGWLKFKQIHPNCELRLTLIHAFEEVFHMENNLLKLQMPLSHLKVFFCEHINVRALNLLSTWYPETLRSIIWVDSHSSDLEGSSQLLVRYRDLDQNEPDPLVIAAWLCTKLEEIVLIGYKYYEEDLVAIARLRGNTLKNLQVASEDVILSDECKNLNNLIEEVSKVFGKSWAPLETNELHPVISNPTDGDSDEYLLPKVLADLHL